MRRPMGVYGCWCAPRSSKPLWTARNRPGGFDSHIFPPKPPPRMRRGFFFYQMEFLPFRSAMQCRERSRPFHGRTGFFLHTISLLEKRNGVPKRKPQGGLQKAAPLASPQDDLWRCLHKKYGSSLIGNWLKPPKGKAFGCCAQQIPTQG